MFSALRQGSPIYILDKKDGLNLKIGQVISVTTPTNFNTYSTGLIDNKMDINVRVGDSNLELKQLCGNQSVATDPVTGTYIAETRELMSEEVNRLIQLSKATINERPYHDSVLEKGDDILKQLDPKYAKEQERDKDISNLKMQVGGMESKLDKIFELLTNKSV